jgi:undecaprenyl-phosphate galactose phosphotransferase
LALLAADIIAFLLTLLVAANGTTAFMTSDPAVWVAVPIFTAVLAGLHDRGEYSYKAALAGEFACLSRYSAYALLLHLLLNLTVFQQPYWNLQWVWVGLPLAAVGMRRLAGLLLTRTGLRPTRTMLIGSDRAMEAVRSMLLTRPMTGLQLVGTLDWATLAADGKPPPWDALLDQHNASLVVVAARGDAADQAVLKSLALAQVPNLPVVVLDRTQWVGDASGPALWFGRNLAERIAKTSLDFIVALSMCLFLAPLLVGVAIVVRLDGGPALFRHERVGYRGRTFFCLKFRTMAISGDAMLQEVLTRDADARREWAATHKLRHDPRVTPIGRVLRATSLDELPQLLNVLRGEMSLVGPRPVIVSELSRYGADAAYYLAAMPGVTGLWQVSGRSETSYDRRVQLDTAYVRTWTFWNDIAILFRTVPAVLLRRGAA